MAGESVVYTSAEAFQDYVRQFRKELYRQLYYGFKTSYLATPFEGVKGEEIISESVITNALVRRWSKSFNPVQAAEIKPVKLVTSLNKVDISVTPQDYEKSYLGILRRKGQNPTDWPFEEYMMKQFMDKVMQEMEYAIWHAEAAAVPNANDELIATFDGYLKHIATAITNNEVTPVATGAFTANNAVASLRTMWADVDEMYKETGTDIFMSYELYDYYRINYKNEFKANPIETETINESGYVAKGLQYELGAGNSFITPVPGLAGSGRVIITPRNNLIYGMDDPSDLSFNFEQEKRELCFWMDFRMGAQILMKRDGILVVNDQA